MSRVRDGRPAPGAPEDLRQDVPLAPLTTLRLGGPARWFLSCEGEADIREGLRWAHQEGLPVALLGDGSNVIVLDDGFPGLVLHIQGGSATFDSLPAGDSLVRVRAAAGVTWDDLVRTSVDRGLSGIECLSGIPGTVGAAPMQNVGAYGQELAHTLTRVRCLDRESLETRIFAADECRFSYRDSRFKTDERGRWVILEVEMLLRRGVRPELRYDQLREALDRDLSDRSPSTYEDLPPEEAITRIRETVLSLRRRKSMVLDPGDPNSRSAGSFFLNPRLDDDGVERIQAVCRELEMDDPPTYPAPGGGTKVPAAWLVEAAGFQRGLRRDGVGISENHALALVHYGGGTTRELLALADEIRTAVLERFGVRLEREPTLLEPREE